ncbi:hypothetical protein C10C_0536 [Chlamydia serpentis]|uniref:Uncharacterized protein n=1 Tax=Chlamydia serpentis TaxID=1967782 RepID=A0A2R8FBR1_9CHLA|nr:hypothetical protein C10C_0536 [Chlamydia serpentis]
MLKSPPFEGRVFNILVFLYQQWKQYQKYKHQKIRVSLVMRRIMFRYKIENHLLRKFDHSSQKIFVFNNGRSDNR